VIEVTTVLRAKLVNKVHEVNQVKTEEKVPRVAMVSEVSSV
jgi:hypothetical protein